MTFKSYIQWGVVEVMGQSQTMVIIMGIGFFVSQDLPFLLPGQIRKAAVNRRA